LKLLSRDVFQQERPTSDHGANRLGASALMQGLADGYFVLPYTIGNYLSSDIRTGKISTDSSGI
jgi:succinate dehydrogenase / fumarate reductase, flavoprotein subunit